MEDSSHWKQTKLSLERPYKNDNGEHLPTLLDITAEGELIYEPKESRAKTLGDNLRRIFTERGADFFEQNPPGFLETGVLRSSEPKEQANEADEDDSDEESGESKPMTVDELFKMRMEIIPHLYIAHGELSHARDLLSLILSSANPTASNTDLTSLIPALRPSQPSEPSQPQPSKPTLSATIVTKPPPIIPLQAFNAPTPADRMERTRLRNERYWVDALRIRRGNWGLTPAPLPFGAPTGKGADKTTKDFVISYGLEESPPAFRRRAVAQMSYTGHPDNLVFPHRQNTRLRIGVTSTHADGTRVVAYNDTSELPEQEGSLEILKIAQREVIEQEIFAQIGKEAGTLPTASARVSERLIHIDAAQNTELTFELIDNKTSASEAVNTLDQAKCDFIYYYLLALLLRRHAYHKQRRLGSGSTGIPAHKPPTAGAVQVQQQQQQSESPPILEPVIHLLQYQVFCRRVEIELNAACGALNKAGIRTSLRFNAVKEIGKELVNLVVDQNNRTTTVGGEATLRVDGRYVYDPTHDGLSVTLTAHLSQATINILSIPELCKLLRDEIEKIVLESICTLGRQICGDVGAVWFVDMNRCVGRWEGCVLNFRVVEEEHFEFSCVVSRFGRKGKEPSLVETYNLSIDMPILTWAKDVIGRSLLEE
ncbi:hypothetical protein VNI00_003265 [Paramarasmius palmivorus]|uniref:Mediator of RNA polymerase II transcription subunit 17 n=1 Tax=Paramarasmius palmivorus TaxID=297713 RepID=A0AAW0DSY1_9AGAR